MIESKNDFVLIAKCYSSKVNGPTVVVRQLDNQLKQQMEHNYTPFLVSEGTKKET